MTFASKIRRFKSLTISTAVVCVLVAFPTLTSAAPLETPSAPAEIVMNQVTVNGVNMVAQSATGEPSIISQSAVVMDLSTGTVVYAKSPTALHYPASITKIMTAILALKLGHLDDRLTASKNAVNQTPDILYMVPGEFEPLQKLLYGLLLISANDAAVEIAEHYGGSVANFASMMNQQARDVGATHTNFSNPNGLPDPHHVTTAYDMALIARYAMQFPEFRKIVRTKYYHYQGEHWQSDLSNLNRMLYYYPGTIGVKTGYTTKAHETLVVAATRGKETFLAVLMDAPTDYEIRHDASTILDYAFSHYRTQTLWSKGQTVGRIRAVGGNTVPVVVADPVVATVPKDRIIEVSSHLVTNAQNAAIPKNTEVGHLSLLEDGVTVATVPVVNARPIVIPEKPLNSGRILMVVGLVAAILLFGTWWLKLRSRR